MSDLQILKNRIKNTKNTSKVTKAMKLIAANKLKKAVRELENFQGGKKIIDSLVHKLVDIDNFEKLSDDYKKLFKKSDNPSSMMLIIISSNKGLCGGFNSNLFKTIENEITILLKDNYDISVMTIGNKAANYFKNHNQEFLSNSYSNSNIPKFEIENAKLANEIILQQFIKGEVHECRIYYNEYSGSSYLPKCEILLPMIMEKTSYDDTISYEGEDLLQKILEQYLCNKIIESLMKSKSGEEFARMVAMDSATNNAIKISDRLVLQYNRTRQADITNQICEIISGSEAL